MRPRLLTLLVLCSLLATTAAGASLAGSAATEDPEPPATAEVTTTPSAAPRCPIPPRFREAFAVAAADARLPLALLVAVAEEESSFRPDAVSEAGARGLLQVMPATARELALDVDDPAANVLAGARYLRHMLDRFDSSDLALAAYNAGPAAVVDAGGAPSEDVLTYVADVTARWRTLHGCS